MTGHNFLYWRKYVHEVLVNRLGGLSLPRKSVVRLTDRPDMTLDVYRGRKTTIQPTNHNFLDTLQVYVTGHKSIGSLNNYRSLSDNHILAISNILSKTDSNDRSLHLPSTSSSGDLNPVQGHPASFSEIYLYCQSVSQNRNTSKSIVEGMFAGSTINYCSINIDFKHNSPPINAKCRRIALSDSDTD